METGRQDFGPPVAEELTAVADIGAQAFAISPPEAVAWVEKVGLPNYRVLREGGTVVGTSVPIPMGQWYGGRRVAMAGVGGVGVAPGARGRGTATRLMQRLVQELRGSGFPLSVLYPSTQPLYRRVGYEQAGSRYELRVQAHELNFTERTLALRPVKPSDQAALQEVYRRHASSRHGYLDRSAYIWDRVVSPRNETAYGFLVEGANGVEGYLYLVRRRKVDLKQELALTDFVALTPNAARRLLSFLGDHRSLALEARGYPTGLSGTLHLEVEDELFPENRGRFLLEVSGGEARVRQGGEGRVRLNVRTLAPLYSGFLSAQALRSVGALEADDASLAVAGALFAGPTPALPDMF